MTPENVIPEDPCHRCKQLLQTSFPTPATSYISLGRRLLSLVSLVNSIPWTYLVSLASWVLGGFLSPPAGNTSYNRTYLHNTDSASENHSWVYNKSCMMMSTWDNAQVKYLYCFCPHSHRIYLRNNLIVFLDTDKWCQSRSDPSTTGLHEKELKGMRSPILWAIAEARPLIPLPCRRPVIVMVHFSVF